jgi:polysaccharide export outer membrane protein
MLKCKLAWILATLVAVTMLNGCSSTTEAPAMVNNAPEISNDYLIGPGDKIQVFVWRNTELSTTVSVRPDGKISVPLIEDLPVAGKTPTQAARAIEEKLSNYVKDAIVTVIMVDFVGPVDRQIRVVGEAAKPLALPFRKGVTVLDVVIQAGGLTQFAAGNRATILRTDGGQQSTYSVRLDDLMKDGDLSANVPLAPGDVLLIPQTWF